MQTQYVTTRRTCGTWRIYGVIFIISLMVTCVPYIHQSICVCTHLYKEEKVLLSVNCVCTHLCMEKVLLSVYTFVQGRKGIVEWRLWAIYQRELLTAPPRVERSTDWTSSSLFSFCLWIIRQTDNLVLERSTDRTSSSVWKALLSFVFLLPLDYSPDWQLGPWEIHR